MMLHAHHLRADMNHEQINIDATDPFVTEIDSNWKVTECVCSYKDAVLKCEQFKETSDTSGISVVKVQTPHR